MRKVFFFLIASLLPVFQVFAESMTSPEFKISLGEMDPMGNSHTVSTTGMQGIFYILSAFSRFLLFMIPVIAIVSMIVAGYYYIFSAGDSEKANKAKTIIKWNIVAIVVALTSWSIIQFVASLFSN